MTDHRELKRALEKRGYNLVKRYIAGEMVAAAISYRSANFLWRAWSINKDGLTPKEKELIEQSQVELEAIYKRLTKLSHRLRQTGTCT